MCSGQPNLSAAETRLCSCFIPFWLVGSWYWCCQCFCLATGRAGAAGREDLGSRKAGSSILESRWSPAAGSGCSIFPAVSKLGQYCILPGFVLLWSSQVAYRLNTGTWSSKVVGIFVIIIEDFGSNLWFLFNSKLRPKIYGYYSRYRVTCGAIEESSHSVLHWAAALKYF